ncbi:hypothetical protein ACHAWC_008356 [Mediolabrus comicus]
MPIPIPAAHLLLHSPAASYAARAAGSSLLAGALGRDLWRRIPCWIKQDVSFQDLFGNNRYNDDDNDFDDGNLQHQDGDGGDEMASLVAVIQKLQALVATGYKKLGSDHKRQRRRRKVMRLLSSASNNKNNSITDTEDSTPISTLEWHLALLAYFQLCCQIRERYPEWRDDMYERYHHNDVIIGDQANNLLDELSSFPQNVDMSSSIDGCSLDTAGSTATANSPVTQGQISELKKQLDYAVWAYETNEELLESQLYENGQYQLLVHRTSSVLLDEDEDRSNDVKDEKMDQRQRQLSSRKNSRRKPPGRVGYYVALSKSENTLLIGIKGTSTLEELLTDCCGRAVRCDLENDPNDAGVMDWQEDEVDTTDDDHDDDSNVYEGSENNPDEYKEMDGLEDDRDGLLRAADAEDICIGKEAELKVCELTMASDQANADGTDHKVDDSKTPLSTDQDHSVLDTINVSDEIIEVQLLDSVEDNPTSRTKSQVQQPLTASRRESHPSENILLLPSRYDRVTESQQLQLRRSTTASTVEDNGIEMQPNRSTKIRGAHEGILHSAQQLLSEISPLVEEYAVSKGFDVVCCGHSLGASCGVLLTILIRGKYPSLVAPNLSHFTGEGRDDDNASSSIQIQRARAYAFAPPPVLDRISSLACRHYVVSVVNNSDIIPRSSLTNLDVLMTMLEAVICVLTETSMNPGATASSTNNNSIRSSVALLKQLSEGTNGELVIEPKELKRIQKEAIYEASLGDGHRDEAYWDEDGDHNLLVPGKVLLLYQKWGASPDIDTGAHKAVWTNGTTKILKGLELGGGSQTITDHLTVSYYHGLKCLEEIIKS